MTEQEAVKLLLGIEPDSKLEFAASDKNIVASALAAARKVRLEERKLPYWTLQPDETHHPGRDYSKIIISCFSNPIDIAPRLLINRARFYAQEVSP